MRRVKVSAVVVGGLLAVFALTATSAFAALPEFLSGFPNKFEAFKQVGAGRLLNLSGEEIKCSAGETLGEITGAKTATIDTHFSGCQALGAFAANTLGDASGVILTGSVTGELCYIKATAPVEVGVFLTLPSALHIEVPSLGLLVTVLGSIIGKVEPINAAAKKEPFKVSFKESAANSGDPLSTTCGGKTASLLSARDTLTEVSSAIQATHEGKVNLNLVIDG